MPETNTCFSLSTSSLLGFILYVVARINIILAAFNLIPIPPLDGSKIALSYAPPDVRNFLLSIERYGFFILIGLLWLGVLDPVIDFFYWMIRSVITILIP